MSNKLLFRLAVLVAAIMSALGAAAAEAYACYTSSNTTLTFYYDNLRSTRTGSTHDLNTGEITPIWYRDGTNTFVTKVIFDSSFADYCPSTTNRWFYYMQNLQSIEGLSYLNTSEVTNMQAMFNLCSSLTSLDLSSFNTAKVTSMGMMFNGCSSLQTIYVGEGWSTAAVTSSNNMFRSCSSLVGGKGTAYNSSNPQDKTYAHIDGGASNPGYFSEKQAFLRGDVNGDGKVTIADVTALVNIILGKTTNYNAAVADINDDTKITIADVTALVNIILGK